MLIYVVYQNTDLMEGKGTMQPRGYFASEAAAHEFVMTRLSTNMGGGRSAAINEQFVATSVEEWLETEPTSRTVWGYRKGWNGQWSEGWVDNRDAPTADPEFAEYQRLKKKFEGLS